MTLIELGKEIFKTSSNHDLYRPIGKEYLKLYEEDIKKCSEFINAKQVVFIDGQIMEDENGQFIESVTIKLQDNAKFTGINYIQSIMETSEIYNPTISYEPIKDGIAVTPTVYNPQNFAPTKKIILRFCEESVPESYETNDVISAPNKDKLKEKLKEAIDKIFDNREEYKIKGEKGIIVRGFFNLSKPLLKSKKVPIFCSDDKLISNGATSLRMQTKYIPEELYELYKKYVKNEKKIITADDVEFFFETSND